MIICETKLFGRRADSNMWGHGIGTEIAGWRTIFSGMYCRDHRNRSTKDKYKSTENSRIS